MDKYFVIPIYILAIILGLKNLIFEIKTRIYDRTLIITNGIKHFNYELGMAAFCMVGFIIFCISLYIRPPELWGLLLGIMFGILGAKDLLKGIKNEIREDGIYTNKGIYKWNEIKKYKWIKVKKKKSLLSSALEYISLEFYIDGDHSEKIIINITMEDLEKTTKFFDEIRLKRSKK